MMKSPMKYAMETCVAGVSQYGKCKEKSEMWDSLIPNVTRVLTEGFGLPEVRCCYEEKATIRCLQCGPCTSYFCLRCAVLVHKFSLLHHCP